ncbi:DUF998 domain-containing protein [Blastococcus xanthinilyticus]|uniref:Uncharacterized protein DUF998 n=1 Tax=Blastococcus xanthinilyticus TaxID=1564164 RepID=A0A5S5CVE9_9ACTN|nr:DUF998 domain-containing protein [Blastococcus xanthinilyticus]TYP87575.1 uncharacterized protein DUF998 [Blastococcus xanthinilyticus]
MTALSAPPRPGAATAVAAEVRPVAGTGSRSAPWFPVVLLGVAVAVLAGIGTDVVGDNTLDSMLSDAVHRPAGGWWLAGCIVGVEIAAAGTALGVHRGMAAGARRTAVLGLLALWSVGLAAVAAFPTDLPGLDTTAWGRVHQVAAAVAMVVPSVVGLLVAAACSLPARRALRGAAVGLGGLGASFLALHVPVVSTGADPVPGIGLVERLLLAGTAATAVLVAAGLAGAEASPPAAEGGLR